MAFFDFFRRSRRGRQQDVPSAVNTAGRLKVTVPREERVFWPDILGIPVLLYGSPYAIIFSGDSISAGPARVKKGVFGSNVAAILFALDDGSGPPGAVREHTRRRGGTAVRF